MYMDISFYISDLQIFMDSEHILKSSSKVWQIAMPTSNLVFSQLRVQDAVAAQTTCPNKGIRDCSGTAKVFIVVRLSSWICIVVFRMSPQGSPLYGIRDTTVSSDLGNRESQTEAKCKILHNYS